MHGSRIRLISKLIDAFLKKVNLFLVSVELLIAMRLIVFDVSTVAGDEGVLLVVLFLNGGQVSAKSSDL